MDLHVHTPGSNDYQEANVTYLDILQKAEQRGLDIVALTDHNTISGFKAMVAQINQFAWLEGAGRITEAEQRSLDEFRRILGKMLVLPGFEFTAMFGFHILGIFSPGTDLRYLEHLLLELKVPADVLDKGETNVGATADVLTAYAAIRDAGGIVVAAHANSHNGVAMKGFPLGGQTRIAYTQDPNLFCLEVTDMDRRGNRTTMRFFDGSKPEYPRPMRCIQGSDAHRLDRDPNNPKNTGIGDRVTEINLPELTFEALYDVLAGTDFVRTRPYRGAARIPYDHVTTARQEGPTIVQDFHEVMSKRGGNLYAIVADVCAFANTNGGTIYIGVSPDPKKPAQGIKGTAQAINELRTELGRKMTPPLDVEIDVLQTEGIDIIRVQVPAGDEPPYAIEDNRIFVRDDTETSLAVRDEIVQLVLRGRPPKLLNPSATSSDDELELSSSESQRSEQVPIATAIKPPSTGVEIIATEERDGTLYHNVHDLRNGNVVRNVTRESARKLWHYAITQTEDKSHEREKLDWRGDLAILSDYSKHGRRRFDLAQRTVSGVRFYFGVTDDGLQDSGHESWRHLLALDEEE